MLEIKDVTVRAGSKEIVSNVSLTVRAGERHVIMGRNGSGKSTLLNAIMGRPGLEVTGQVKFGDCDNILELPVNERVKLGIFFSVQSPMSIAGIANGRLLHYALESLGREVKLTDVLPEFVNEANELKLPEKWHLRSFNVDASGGEKKKNEMLFLKMFDSPFIMLDEIESGLDVDARQSVANVLQSLSADKGLLMVSHDPCITPTHVHVMQSGKLLRSGPAGLAEEIVKNGYEHLFV
jgi:Fe-S cluster assembly ATP-binding protein